jgi:hypothetical protein
MKRRVNGGQRALTLHIAPSVFWLSTAKSSNLCITPPREKERIEKELAATRATVIESRGSTWAEGQRCRRAEV